MYKYAIEIFYSQEDKGYIAVAPELPGCSAYGDTEEVALKEIMTAVGLWIETAKREGRKVPSSSAKATADKKAPGVELLSKFVAMGKSAGSVRLQVTGR